MELKNIYTGNEVKFSALFGAVQESLFRDFVTAHPEFLENTKEISGMRNNAATHAYNSTGAWKVGPIKHYEAGWIKLNCDRYRTGYALASAFGNECVTAGYSVLEPGGVIYRHTDTCNRAAKYIRVHIPLSIPDGDLGFEVSGETVHWNEIFAFNNQKLHSAWNLTGFPRLIFAIDLTRECMGLPLAPAWQPGCNDHVAVFSKTLDPIYNK